ncbi:MAG TPA: polyprenyl synthetase family protein, partial [Actinotalea sp.]|nr:polyprenyl synthetase family protein [Actinotalea sp.]
MIAQFPLDEALSARVAGRLTQVESRLVEAASHADHIADAASRH